MCISWQQLGKYIAQRGLQIWFQIDEDTSNVRLHLWLRLWIFLLFYVEYNNLHISPDLLGSALTTVQIIKAIFFLMLDSKFCLLFNKLYSKFMQHFFLSLNFAKNEKFVSSTNFQLIPLAQLILIQSYTLCPCMEQTWTSLLFLFSEWKVVSQDFMLIRGLEGQYHPSPSKLNILLSIFQNSNFHLILQ